MIRRFLNSIFVTRDLIEIIVKIDHEISENGRYFDIISGRTEGLIIRQFTLNGDEEFLFTGIEKGDGTHLDIKMKEPTFVKDVNLINDIFNEKSKNIQFLGKYPDYNIKNMANIVSLISKNDDMPNLSVIEYLSKGLSMTSNKITELYSYLEDFKIKRINGKNGMIDMTEGEKQRLRIIKMILDDRPIWIINDCLFNINDITKRDIISVIMNKVIEGNKTIIVTDSSNSADYWN